MDDADTFSAAGLWAPHPLAAAAGRDVLAEGGTVVEAALAAAMVSAVVAPDRAGLGGDALWLVREPGPRGRVRALDARGTVAAAARPSFFRARDHEAVPRHGPEAVLVAPGAGAGWIEAQALAASSGGRLPTSRLLAPAVAAARDGWALSARDAAALAGAPAGDGEAPKAGARRVDPVLAATLDYLAGAGLDDLYRGDVARELAADLDALACPLGRSDLRHAGARWREARALDLGRVAVAVPPTRSGMRAAAALGLAGGLAAAGFDVAKADGFGRWHGLIEALRAADRLVDDALASGRDPAALLDPARLTGRALALDRGRAGRAAPPPFPGLAEAACWIGAVDRDGAAVSVVHTMGSAFGSGVVSTRTGIALGNRGAALALDPDLGPMLRPGRRVPLDSLPALLSSGRDGRVAALGAAGSGAAAAVVQLAERLMRGMGAAAAAAAPRFALGATPDGRDAAVLVEAEREPGPVPALRAAGHQVVEGGGMPWTPGLVLRDGTGRVAAAGDDGDAAGL